MKGLYFKTFRFKTHVSFIKGLYIQ